MRLVDEDGLPPPPSSSRPHSSPLQRRRAPLSLMALLLDPPRKSAPGAVDTARDDEEEEEIWRAVQCSCAGAATVKEGGGGGGEEEEAVTRRGGPLICFVATRGWRAFWRCTIRIAHLPPFPGPSATAASSSSFALASSKTSAFPIRVGASQGMGGGVAPSCVGGWRQVLQEMVRIIREPPQGDIVLRHHASPPPHPTTTPPPPTTTATSDDMEGMGEESALEFVFSSMGCSVVLERMSCTHTPLLHRFASRLLADAYFQLQNQVLSAALSSSLSTFASSVLSTSAASPPHAPPPPPPCTTPALSSCVAPVPVGAASTLFTPITFDLSQESPHMLPSSSPVPLMTTGWASVNAPPPSPDGGEGGRAVVAPSAIAPPKRDLVHPHQRVGAKRSRGLTLGGGGDKKFLQ